MNPRIQTPQPTTKFQKCLQFRQTLKATIIAGRGDIDISACREQIGRISTGHVLEMLDLNPKEIPKYCNPTDAPNQKRATTKNLQQIGPQDH